MVMTIRSIHGRWVLAGMLLAAATTGLAVARAQQAPDPAGPCANVKRFLTADDREAIGQVIMNRVKEKLGLSDQQAEEIRATLKAVGGDARTDVQALCQARLELRRLLEAQNSDPAAVKAAGERIKALQAKLMDRRLDAYLALRSKLTADQWAKWVEFRKEMGHRFMGRFRPSAS